MVFNRMENTQVGESTMCQASAGLVNKPDSDDEFKWEEFFSTSVDITSTLLDIFDTMVAENAPKVPSTPLKEKREDPGGGKANYSKRSYSNLAFQEKKRPLSSSSVSSSSSSSSSSRHDVKKSYLASIESLDDEEEDTVGPQQRARWCDPQFSHTDRVLLEILDTEKTYVRDLREIIQGYLKHIVSSQNPRVSHQYLKELFSNVEDIYEFNSLFVDNLESCGLDPVAVARCFVNNSDGFEVYTQYCTNYPRTVSVLTEFMGNGETAEIFKERQLALQHSLPLGSYLLKPVQRILKYHLLLQSLAKHCKEKESAEEAVATMTGIAAHINDMKRRHEHAVRVQEIQSLLYGWQGEDLTTYGELVAEGAFRMFRAKALRHLFLFDRMLLIAKKREEAVLSHKAHIMCSNLMLIESIQGEPLCFHVIPFDNPRYQYTFQAKNVEQKREWCLQLKRVILENYNAVIPSHAAKLLLQLGQGGPPGTHEDCVLEKSATRRQLSAPEYLEKRKQERRKSEINRTLKIKKGLKKGELIFSHKNNFENGRRKSTSSRAEIHHSWDGGSSAVTPQQAWTKSQDDISQTRRWFSGRFGHSNKACISTESNVPLTRSTRLRHSLPEPSLQRAQQKEPRFRWNAWNSVPEETTDTENEDIAFRGRTYSELSEEPLDVSGEYVTFFYAHAYATRDMHQNDKPREEDVQKVEDKIKDQDSESGSSVSSWKQMSALRRVQSFTGMAKAKVISLQHHMSFRHASSRKLPPSPTTPATWLQNQEKHLAEGGKKSGSLPRSFQLQAEAATDATSDVNVPRTRMRIDGQRAEQRPFTIASDKPSQADFGDDLDYVVLDYSHCAKTGYPFLVSIEPDNITGCTNTPAVSMENVHAIHPELKIYHQAASKYATLKHVFSHMGAKIAGLKANFASGPSQEQNGFKRSSSRSSVKSDSELNPKLLTAKVAHSVAKAYFSVMKHKRKHEIHKTADPQLEKLSNGTYKSESSLIGARMAQPLESEYSVPKYILPKSFKDELRPDSLFSESSQASSDGDKVSQPLFLKDEGEDTASEASDTSADSYYERTFDAIENALAQDIFRDSAIYSDPEDADFSTVETPRDSGQRPRILCARRVNQTILDRLRVLELSVQLQDRPVEEGETSSSASTVSTVMESGDRGQPRVKGWVKHVVDKLQGEGRI